MCLRLEHLLNLLKELLHCRWLSWDNKVVYIRHDYEVDVTWRVASCESARSSFEEPESSESAMISVNLWDHTADAWDAKWLVRDTESLEALAWKWVLLTRLQECWYMLMPHLTMLNSTCEADSSSNDLESRCLRRASVLCLLVNDLSEPFPTNRALENAWARSNDPRDSMTLDWSSWEGSLRGTRSYTSWTWTAKRNELLLDGFLDFLLWISLKISLIPFLKFEILKQLKFLIFFWLIAIDWLLTDL